MKGQYCHWTSHGKYGKYPLTCCQGHTVLTLVLVTLTVAVSAGYGVACSNISSKLSGQLNAKLNNNKDIHRGENLDERCDKCPNNRA